MEIKRPEEERRITMRVPEHCTADAGMFFDGHPAELALYEALFRRMAVEEHPRIRCAVLWYAHSASPLPAS